MRILTLLENHENPDYPALQAEHGLSFIIALNGHDYMSDVGASGFFTDNAARLGVDLTRVEGVVISHHHYDHGGGLGRFFEENDQAKIYLRLSHNEGIVAEDTPGVIRTIGLNDALLRKHKDRVRMVTHTGEVMPGLHVVTDIPCEYPKPSGDQRLKIKIGKMLQSDPFNHELVTVLENEEGLVVLTGCAHNGVLNMIAAVQKAFPGKTILAVIGGFHLHHEGDDSVRQIAERLKELGIPIIATGHCTGDHAVGILEAVLGDRLVRLFTGLEMVF
jgi:7,8-dihydropterin-6-yl-methyl-4-(beta-D-ribofuranosyl)aminobenzene 5'-phosphate synthase